MYRYLGGELYRLAHKKSLYGYFGAFALAYLLFAFIRSAAADSATMQADAATLFSLLPAVVGGSLFAAIYTDDLSSKNLATLVGFGLGKTTLVLAKLVLMIIMAGVIYSLVPLFMFGSYALMGQLQSLSALQNVYMGVSQAFLITIAVSAVCAIVVYGFQRATFGIVSYLVLALGVVDELLSILLSWDLVQGLLPGLADHLIFSIVRRLLSGIILNDGTLFVPCLEYGACVALAAVVSILVFKNRELEF